MENQGYILRICQFLPGQVKRYYQQTDRRTVTLFM